jgi:hypothetical protein
MTALGERDKIRVVPKSFTSGNDALRRYRRSEAEHYSKSRDKIYTLIRDDQFNPLYPCSINM